MKKKIWIIIAMHILLSGIMYLTIDIRQGIIFDTIVLILWIVIEIFLVIKLLYYCRKFKIFSMRDKKVELKLITYAIEKHDENECVMEVIEAQSKAKKTLVDEILINESLIEKVYYIEKLLLILWGEKEKVFIKNKSGKLIQINSMTELMEEYLDLLCRMKISKCCILYMNQSGEVNKRLYFTRFGTIKMIFDSSVEQEMKDKVIEWSNMVE